MVVCLLYLPTDFVSDATGVRSAGIWSDAPQLEYGPRLRLSWRAVSGSTRCQRKLFSASRLVQRSNPARCPPSDPIVRGEARASAPPAPSASGPWAAPSWSLRFSSRMTAIRRAWTNSTFTCGASPRGNSSEITAARRPVRDGLTRGPRLSHTWLAMAARRLGSAARAKDLESEAKLRAIFGLSPTILCITGLKD